MLDRAKDLLQRLARRIGDRLTRSSVAGIEPYYRGAAQRAVRARDEFLEGDQQHQLRADLARDSHERSPGDDPNATPQRIFTVREYLQDFARRTGREPNDKDVRTIVYSGCLGVVAHYIGMTDGRMLPSHLAFGDPDAHRQLATVDRILLPGDKAAAEVATLRTERDIAAELHDRLGTPLTRMVLEEVDTLLAKTEAAAAQAMAALPSRFRTELLEYRMETRREGSRRTFHRISEYEEELRSIFAQSADADEVRRRIDANENLRRIPNIGDDLPQSHPSQWRVDKVNHQYWTGQGDLPFDPAREVGLPDPDPWAFAPDAVTNHIDMSRYQHLARPGGFSNFDYAVYDADSATWFGANHSIVRANSPVRVLQMTSDQLFAGSTAFDGTCMYLIVSDMVPATG
ncbi:hypothetical protein [Nocardia brasiliensis]|uniref:hypothetical protein n=1 Tax=Nocardia brasiliensis TaxID=37326 RepID=UPI002458B7BA|nr:hypothetical protein [Nocardia brasiliensis]